MQRKSRSPEANLLRNLSKAEMPALVLVIVKAHKVAVTVGQGSEPYPRPSFTVAELQCDKERHGLHLVRDEPITNRLETRSIWF